MSVRGLLLALAIALALTAPVAAAMALSETGSTLLYPLVATWASAYQQIAPAVRVNVQATGSGAGISQVIGGQVQLGGSDVYASDLQMARYHLLNIPLALSAQLISYNLPEVGQAHLRLNGDVLAEIYSGTIVYWDDAKIAALNPDLAAKLVHKKILPVRRSDRSGDTALFTHYLSDAVDTWKNGPGTGTKIAWPANGLEIMAQFNRGVVDQLRIAPYSLGYVGISYLNQANALGLGYAALENPSKLFVLPTGPGLVAAAEATSRHMPDDERVSLIDAPSSDAYPIVNYEYAIVNARQTDDATAEALRAFLLWTISPQGGSDPRFLTPVNFASLPAPVAKRSRKQIATIQ